MKTIIYVILIAIFSGCASGPLFKHQKTHNDYFKINYRMTSEEVVQILGSPDRILEDGSHQWRIDERNYYSHVVILFDENRNIQHIDRREFIRTQRYKKEETELSSVAKHKSLNFGEDLNQVVFQEQRSLYSVSIPIAYGPTPKQDVDEPNLQVWLINKDGSTVQQFSKPISIGVNNGILWRIFTFEKVPLVDIAGIIIIKDGIMFSKLI